MDLHYEDPDMEGWNDMYFDDDEPSDLEDADFANEDAFMDKINDVRDSDDEDDADDDSESETYEPAFDEPDSRVIVDDEVSDDDLVIMDDSDSGDDEEVAMPRKENAKIRMPG
jgi:hypothetical protein